MLVTAVSVVISLVIGVVLAAAVVVAEPTAVVARQRIPWSLSSGSSGSIRNSMSRSCLARCYDTLVTSVLPL
jgi:hypothetical protein